LGGPNDLDGLFDGFGREAGPRRDLAIADAFVRLRPQQQAVDRLHGAAPGQQRSPEASPDAQGVDFAPIHPPDIP
jgi:hypothetical protein